MFNLPFSTPYSSPSTTRSRLDELESDLAYLERLLMHEVDQELRYQTETTIQAIKQKINILLARQANIEAKQWAAYIRHPHHGSQIQGQITAVKSTTEQYIETSEDRRRKREAQNQLNNQLQRHIETYQTQIHGRQTSIANSFNHNNRRMARPSGGSSLLEFKMEERLPDDYDSTNTNLQPLGPGPGPSQSQLTLPRDQETYTIYSQSTGHRQQATFGSGREMFSSVGHASEYTIPQYQDARQSGESQQSNNQYHHYAPSDASEDPGPSSRFVPSQHWYN